MIAVALQEDDPLYGGFAACNTDALQQFGIQKPESATIVSPRFTHGEHTMHVIIRVERALPGAR
jgi:hypothetical protein